MGRAPVVAVINTSPDTVDLLRLAFEYEGFVAVSAMTFEIRDGKVVLDEFLGQHKPDVAIYDVALPYQANWQLLQHLRTTTRLREVPIIITTTNAAHVRPFAGAEPVYEIVGKPYDLEQLIATAREAIQKPA
jgi:chemosensory pili system protein ChpA (sensor histidine kinase/response regulator)